MPLLVAVFAPPLNTQRVATSRTSAIELRHAALTWRALHDTCPTPESLRRDSAIDPASRLLDAWDQPFRIACQEDDVIVTSSGPDRRPNTPDDLIVPSN